MYFFCCRETEWLFSSDPGRRQLAESAGFEHLVVVTLHQGHTYSSLDADAVKEEVAGKAVELVQQGLPHGKQVHVHVCAWCIVFGNNDRQTPSHLKGELLTFAFYSIFVFRSLWCSIHQSVFDILTTLPMIITVLSPFYLNVAHIISRPRPSHFQCATWHWKAGSMAWEWGKSPCTHS